MTAQQLQANRLHVGRQITAAREAVGMTQVQLSESTGIYQSNINRIEKGKYNVGLDILSKISAALGCEIVIPSPAHFFEP